MAAWSADHLQGQDVGDAPGTISLLHFCEKTLHLDRLRLLPCLTGCEADAQHLRTNAPRSRTVGLSPVLPAPLVTHLAQLNRQVKADALAVSATALFQHGLKHVSDSKALLANNSWSSCACFIS